MFLFLGFGAAHVANLPAATVTTSKGPLLNTSNLLFIAFAFGFSLLVNVWLFVRVSGAVFNPAVAVALLVARVMPPLRFVVVVSAQILGGITAAGLIESLLPGKLSVSTRLGNGTSVAQGNSLIFIAFLINRIVYRDVPDGGIGSHGFHAGRGKAQIYVPCTSRPWCDTFHDALGWYPIYRRQRQSREELWTRCRYSQLSRLPLDLLYAVRRSG